MKDKVITIMDDNTINEILPVEDSKAKEGEKRKTSSKLKAVNDSLAIVSAVALIWAMVALLNSPIFYLDSSKYVEKGPLLKKISVMVKNGASLDLVKHTYEMRPMVRPRLFMKFEPEQYYTDKIPLSIVLNDISANYHSAEPFEKDSLFITRLSSMIKENNYHNPFDNLEETQIPFFENIRIKAGSQYDIIQSDIVRIATEMSHKNQLVSKYLTRSNLSFIISIVALALTIILSIIQLVQSSKANERIKGIYAELNSEAIEEETDE